MPRPLGVFSAAALVVANMIGAGAFTTSGYALADLGSAGPVLLAWLIGGIVAMCGAISYAALARRVPESGGEYVYLSRLVHPLAGFLAGWVSLLAGFTAPIAACGLALQAYLSAAIGPAWRAEWIGTAAIVIAGLMHGLRRPVGVALQNLAVGLKLAALVTLVAVGLPRLFAGGAGAVRTWGPFEPAAFGRTLVWISFAYSGWNAAVYVAGELRDPARDVRRALYGATALVTGLYLALNAVLLAAAPPAVLAGRADIGAVAAEAIGGTPLRRAVAGLVALALFTSISSMVMAGARVYARMGADGVLPPALAAGGDAPGVAVALQTGLAIAVLWMGTLAQLLGYIGFTLGLSAAACVAALLLRRPGGEPRGAAPVWAGGAFVIATLATSALMVVRAPLEAAIGLATVAAGVPVYLLGQRWTGSKREPGTVDPRC